MDPLVKFYMTKDVIYMAGKDVGQDLATALGVENALPTENLILELMAIALENAGLFKPTEADQMFKKASEASLEDDWADKLIAVAAKSEGSSMSDKELDKIKDQVKSWGKKLATESIEKLTSAYKKLGKDATADDIQTKAKETLKAVLKRWNPDKQFPGYNLLTGYKKRMEEVVDKASVTKKITEAQT